jgi:diketogulonate reductase-like aldo/keto reductase
MVHQVHGSVFSQHMGIRNLYVIHGIPLVAHSPFGFKHRVDSPEKDKILDIKSNYVVSLMCKKYDRTSEEIAIKYLIQHGYVGVLLPLKSATGNGTKDASDKAFQTSNDDTLMWQMDKKDLEQLDGENGYTQTWTLSKVTNCVSPTYVNPN